MAISAPGFRRSAVRGFEFHLSQYSLRSGDIGNTDGFLCTNSGRTFLLPDGHPRHHGCTSPYGGQHLLVTGHAMVCAVFRDRGNPLAPLRTLRTAQPGQLIGPAICSTSAWPRSRWGTVTFFPIQV